MPPFARETLQTLRELRHDLLYEARADDGLRNPTLPCTSTNGAGIAQSVQILRYGMIGPGVFLISIQVETGLWGFLSRE